MVTRAVTAKYSASLCQPDDGDDRMNEKDDNIAHPGMLSKPVKHLIMAQFSNSPDTSTAVATALTERRAELKSAALVLVEGSGCPDWFPTPDRARS